MNTKCINRNTMLFVDGWGDCRVDDLALVLNGVIYKFQGIINPDRYTKDTCVIQTWEEHPFCFSIENGVQGIGLSARDRKYSQYVYQFAHEYCHFLINRDNKGNRSGAYWFEETICELASIFMLRMMEYQWQKNPPYPTWQPYFASFKKYVEEIINRPSNTIDAPLNKWINDRLDLLHQPEYQRGIYTTIAVQIMDIFFEDPNLWNIITYFKEVNKLQYTSFENYIRSLHDVLPDSLKPSFKKLMDRLI